MRVTCVYIMVCLLGLWGTSVQSNEFLSPAPANTSDATKNGGGMAIDEKLFENVPLNTRELSPCSPKDPGPNWRGILIQAPKQVSFGRTGKGETYKAIPVCGLYTLDMLSLMDGKPMRLIAVDKHSQKIYTGEVIDEDPSPEVPPPGQEPLDYAQLKGLATGSYFNVNLVSYVKLPVHLTEYEVMVEYGGNQSNKVTIKIVEEH